MVKLNRIYTRKGDQGDTSLGSGPRLPKHHVRLEAIGAVDEANAAIGVARLYMSDELQSSFSRIQNDLFDVGADLCVPHDHEKKPGLRIHASQVERLEQEIDHYNHDLSPLNSFVLPGGSPASAHLHLARTIVRRAERIVCNLAEKEPVNPEVIRYLNRLSDHLFVLSRTLNENGAKDVLWVPGENR